MTSNEFTVKFTNLNDLLFGFAMKLTKNRDDAKDLMQETAMRAYANIEKFKTGTNFKAWVSTIMRNSFINKYRKKRTRNEVEQPIEEVSYLMQSKTIEGLAFSNIMTQEILSMIEELKDRYKTPFVMHYQGFEYKEISSHLDVPMGTVKSRIHTARTQLKTMIKRRYSEV